MIEHLSHLGNCHGELTFLGSLLLSVPFVGTWLRARRAKKVKTPIWAQVESPDAK